MNASEIYTKKYLRKQCRFLYALHFRLAAISRHSFPMNPVHLSMLWDVECQFFHVILAFLTCSCKNDGHCITERVPLLVFGMNNLFFVKKSCFIYKCQLSPNLLNKTPRAQVHHIDKSGIPAISLSALQAGSAYATAETMLFPTAETLFLFHF